MEEQFDRSSACERRLRELLQLTGDGPIERGLLTAFVDCCEQSAGPKEPGAFEISLGRWVLRTDDLGIFAALRTAFMALGAAGLAQQTLTMAGMAALATGTLELLWNVFRVTGRVNTRQANILSIMHRAREPLTAEEIYRQPNPDGDLEWSLDQIEKELEGLQQVVTGGGVRKMVERLSNGRWVLNGA